MTSRVSPGQSRGATRARGAASMTCSKLSSRRSSSRSRRWSRRSPLTPSGLRDRLGDERRVAKRGEADPEDAGLERGHQRPRHLDSEPRLSGPARADQGDEPGAGLDVRAHLLELALPADEGARGAGEVRVRDRPERRERFVPSWKTRTGRSNPASRCSPRSVSSTSSASPAVGAREDDLASVRRGRHPRREVHVGADVALLGQERLPDVESRRTRIGPAERVRQLLRGGDRRGRVGEGEEESVALGVHLDAVMARAGRTDQATMLRQRLGEALLRRAGAAAWSSPRRR